MTKKFKYIGDRFPDYINAVLPLAYEQPDGTYMLYVGNNTGLAAYPEELEEVNENGKW